METYTERITEIRKSIKHTAGLVGDALTSALKFNNKLLKDARQGDYLIKWTNKYICLSGIGYLHYSYTGDHWFTSGTRDNAQWFSKEEAKEIVEKYNKSLKMVKR